jgi:hypothetical protein
VTESDKLTSLDSPDEITAAVMNGDDFIIVSDSKRSLEEAIGNLDDEDVGSLFQKLAARYKGSYVNATSDDQLNHIKAQLRRVLGPRYSSLLLTSVTAGILKDERDSSWSASLKSCVEESLQWHEDAVFAEALIYFKDGPASEELIHECAVIKASNIADNMGKFLSALDGYVRDCGSSVRTKAHLKLISLPVNEKLESLQEKSSVKSTPLDPPKCVLFFNSPLELPEGESSREGSQSQFSRIVQDTLGSSLALSPTFEVVHYAAGSDAVGDESVRATAHLYVVFQRSTKGLIALDYAIAMRETLGRLAIAFALDRMLKAKEDLKARKREEENQHKKFESEVKRLSDDIRGLQYKANKVISMVTPSVWTSLRNWIPVIRDLSDFHFRDETFVGKGIGVEGAHPWGPRQWAMALLKLVNATEEDIPSGVSDPVQVWRLLNLDIRQKSQTSRRIHPIWRCLDRMGIPMVPEIDEQWHPNNPTDQELRRSLVRNWSAVDSNGFVGLFLLFAIGAKYDPVTQWKIYAKEMLLVKTLKAPVVIDGLNMLHDMLTPEWSGVRSIGIHMADDGTSLNLQVPLPEPDVQFSKICTRITGLLGASDHPGYSDANIGLSVLTSLGVGEECWRDAVTHIEIDASNGVIKRKDDNNRVVAMCVGGNNGLSISYALVSYAK